MEEEIRETKGKRPREGRRPEKDRSGNGAGENFAWIGLYLSLHRGGGGASLGGKLAQNLHRRKPTCLHRVLENFLRTRSGEKGNGKLK